MSEIKKATTTSMSTPTTADKAREESGKSGELCVVDLGKHSRKQIRRLRKGEGKLMGKAEGVIQDLKDNGVIAKDANTVLLVVRQKSKGVASLLD